MAKPKPKDLSAVEKDILKTVAEKRKSGKKLTRQELATVEKARDIQFRKDLDKFVNVVPASLYYESSKQTDHLARQMVKEFGIPIPPRTTETFDLRVFFEWFHRFFEENQKKLSQLDADDLMTGPNSPWREKYCREQTLMTRLKRRREEGKLWPHEMVIDKLLVAVNGLRRCEKKLRKECGDKAASHFEKGINEFVEKLTEQFENEGEKHV